MNIKEIAINMQELGVGELILNSIENDGKMNGYDLKLLSEISQELSIPVIISGGAKTINDFKLAKECGASACAASSMFIYHGPHRAVLISYPNYNKLREILGE
jgi:cyclase